MDLSEKFSKGAETHTYQRIGSEYRTDVFLGYSDSGDMSMVIAEFAAPEKVDSSKLIEAVLTQRVDGKKALSFNLLDNAYDTMFMVFCKDIIMECEKVDREKTISSAINRWNYWKELFGKKKRSLLNKAEIKGLIGELIELKRYFIPKFGDHDAIVSWMGPLYGHKDFEVFNTWYEVKTISENAIQVEISSLEQLESASGGHLSIVRVEDTSSTKEGAINLNKMVVDVADSIKNQADLDLFMTRLDNVGYSMEPDYENYCFLYLGTETYTVDDSFPRMQRSDVATSIINVRYSILIDGISRFKEEELDER